MADYTGGTQRAQYLQGWGFPIDTLQARSLGDPTPAWVSLLADIDRLQWGLMTDWGHPGYFVSCGARDGGYSGSSGSYATTASTFPIVLIVPPRVEWAHVGVYGSGSIEVKITNTHDSTGVLIKNATGTPSDFAEQEVVSASFSEGVDANGGLKSRALKVSGSGTNDANSSALACEISVSRGDLNPNDYGAGGVLWGLRFVWDRGPLGTFKAGTTTADDITI